MTGSATLQRDTREEACELKCLLEASVAEAVMDWARAHLQPDPNLRPGRDSYQVSSIYLDTRERDVLRRRGSYARSKYRVRRYDDADTVFVERKTKTRQLVNKRRELLPLAALPAAGLLGAADSASWFWRRARVRGLAPVYVVQYQRFACVGTSAYGPLRLTLDSDLLAWPTAALQFAPQPASRALVASLRILELKYRQVLPVEFRSLIAQFALTTRDISKYQLAARVLEPELQEVRADA
ncbi:MAG: polyphosphate polymerase domain-containing protein [Steroidobacteraceae bacterium]